jgi:polyhydroxyalkanoate synthesis regulator phasin
MIDADRLELVDTGDGVPLTKCEQNLYEALANVQDLMTNHPSYHQETVKRLEDALEDMGELVAEVKRLRKQVEALFSEIRRLEGDDGEWIE